MDLDYNCIQELPPEIGELSNLKALWLCNNQLWDLPEEMKKLKKLEKLYLGNIKFEIFPEVLKKIKNLKELYIDKDYRVKFRKEINILEKYNKNLNIINYS